MKILIFLKKWTGGVGVVVRSIKKELEEKGHEVICISREEDLKCKSSTKNLLWLRKKYKAIIKKENPDVIYTQDWSMAIPLIFPFRIHKKNHYCCFHGSQLGKTRFIQTIVGKIMKDRLVVVGDSLKKRFFYSNKIYNGVDIKKFKPLNKKRNYIGWVNKESEMLNRRDLAKMAKRLGLKPLIAENFEIPFDEMNKKFYNRCEVFISLPPKNAGFNLVWIEAMAAGIPKIIGNREGIGFKLNIDKFQNKKDLFENLNNLKRKNYRKELIKTGFTWENHVNKLVQIWKK